MGNTREKIALIFGFLERSMLKNEILNFCYLGTFIERFDNTVRILNTRYYLLLDEKKIRFEASPRHVPSKIIKVNDIPRTKNGKIVELAVKNLIEGNEIKNKEALANPDILEEYKNIRELNV